MIVETRAYADHATAASSLRQHLSQEISHRALICIGSHIKQVQKMFGVRYSNPVKDYEGLSTDCGETTNYSQLTISLRRQALLLMSLRLKHCPSVHSMTTRLTPPLTSSRMALWIGQTSIARATSRSKSSLGTPRILTVSPKETLKSSFCLLSVRNAIESSMTMTGDSHVSV